MVYTPSVRIFQSATSSVFLSASSMNISSVNGVMMALLKARCFFLHEPKMLSIKIHSRSLNFLRMSCSTWPLQYTMAGMGNEEENPFLRVTSPSEPITRMFERSAFSDKSDNEKYWYVSVFLFSLPPPMANTQKVHFPAKLIRRSYGT